ncbi:MAG: 2-dehydropantoate 2-reductase [Clostridia bacterium]|nr:2-dehydropantoate 2-reductase [Clostridia bacterium]
MRAAIYGAGAMGTVLGAFISAQGKQIDLITRNKEHVEALKSDGAQIIGKANFVAAVSALTPDEMQDKYDIIFLMTKQRDNHKILSFLTDYLADDGVVCTLQNGLPEPSVSSVVGESRCMGCAVSWGATLRGAGVSELTSERKKMTFSLGTPGERNPKTDEVKALLECAGKVKEEENFYGARWAKLAINCAFSPLSAITGMTFGEVASKSPANKIALKLLNEAFDVAEKCGVKIEKLQGHDIVRVYRCSGGVKQKIALYLLPLAMKNHKNLVSGMYYDLSAGKKCDINYVNGVLVRIGKKFGADVSLNKSVIDLARKIEKGELKISPDNLKLILK